MFAKFPLLMHYDLKRIGTLLAAVLLAPIAAVHAADGDAIDLTKRTWQGIPGIERTAQGRVFASWFTGGLKEPSPDNTVVLARSDDGGKTFSAPEAMALPGIDGTRCFDPTLWIDPKGRLWYIFNRGNKDTAKHDVWARICDDPDAAVPVWGAEFRVGYDVPFAFRMNKVTVLSTGEWLMPVTLAEKAVRGWGTGYNDQQTPTLHGVGISTDEGRTWKLHGAVKSRPWALENMITELKDGRLWMLIRTSTGVLWQSHSTDRGRTWSEGTASTIKSPGSRFFIRRLASGDLLLVNHHKFTGRSHLTAQLSTDDGATWNDGLLLDERGGVSYPDGVQDRNGLIWITYDCDRSGAGEILLAKFREEDVAAGKDVSGAVTLHQVINKLEKPKLLRSDWDPKASAGKALSSMIQVTGPEVKGAHDSDLVMVGDRAFVVALANDVKPGHGAREAQYCTMSVVNLESLQVERRIPIAKSQQVFANHTLPVGACFVPRVLQLNPTTLRCYFACEDQSGRGQAQIWYRDFDVPTLAFSPEIHRMKVKTATGKFDLEPKAFHDDAVAQGFTQKLVKFGVYLIDSFKVIDGRTYAVINNYPGAQNALAVLNESRDTLEIIGHYNEPAALRLTESSVNRLPDGSWLAICRAESGDRNYVFTTSKDGRTWTRGEPRPFVTKGSNSKPTFDKFNGVFYLGWQEATRITGGHGVGRKIFNIEVSLDGVTWERKYRFESEDSFQYPTFRQHTDGIWFTVTQGTGGSTDRIMFGKLEDVGVLAAGGSSRK